MSKYSIDYLQTHTLVGDVAVNGLPWTARNWDSSGSDAVDTNHRNSNGKKWLWDGKVPLKAAKEFFAGFQVDSRFAAQVRPARPGDTNLPTFTGEDDILYVVILDQSRQYVSDTATDFPHFVPKAGYVIHPFTENLIERTARIVGDSAGSLHIDSVGVLADGGEGWVSIATGSLITLPEGVDYYPHVLASSSHTGTLATSLQAVITMTVCDNTRACALGEGKANGTVSKARHSKQSQTRLSEGESEARIALGLMDTANEEFAENVKTLCETPVSDKQWDAFMDSLAPITEDSTKNAITRAENFRDSVTGIYRNDARNLWTGTAFGALQAVNTHDLWERKAHTGTDVALRNMRDTITGKSDARETERFNALQAVLVATA